MQQRKQVLMDLILVDDWKKFSNTLTPKKQAEYLKDSYDLHRESPNHSILFYIMLTVVMILFKSMNANFMFGLAAGYFIIHLLSKSLIYLLKMKAFKDKWYTKITKETDTYGLYRFK